MLCDRIIAVTENLDKAFVLRILSHQVEKAGHIVFIKNKPVYHCAHTNSISAHIIWHTYDISYIEFRRKNGFCGLFIHVSLALIFLKESLFTPAIIHKETCYDADIGMYKRKCDFLYIASINCHLISHVLFSHDCGSPNIYIKRQALERDIRFQCLPRKNYLCEYAGVISASLFGTLPAYPRYANSEQPEISRTHSPKHKSRL